MSNLLDNASNQPFKFRARNWVDINDESRGAVVNVKFKVRVKFM